MAVRPRSPRGEGERLRATLLDVATELLAEVHDIERLSVRAVTSRAGVSPTALYMHFADKDELVDEIKRRCFVALGDRIRQAAAAHPDQPRARLLAMGQAYLAFAREQPGWYAVCFHTDFGFEDSGFAVTERSTADAGMQVFFLLFDAVADDTKASEQDAWEVATILWTALHGRASLLQAMPGCPLPEEAPWLARLATVCDVHAAADGPPG